MRVLILNMTFSIAHAKQYFDSNRDKLIETILFCKNNMPAIYQFYEETKNIFLPRHHVL